MDAPTALAELLALGGDVAQAIVLDGDGDGDGDGVGVGVVASTLARDRADAFAAAVRDLVTVGERVKPGRPAGLTRLVARVDAGAVVVVRGDRLLAAAVTAPDASIALAAHDLRALVRQLESESMDEGADAGA